MKLLQHFKELTVRPKNAQELKGLILQLAIQGKLTANWRTENPDVEPASELLNRIQKDKEQLVKDKKIRKEKPLVRITKDEIPYELPLSWVWVKLGEVSSLINGDRGKNYPSKEHYIPKGIPFITARNLGERFLKHDALNYISEERYNLLRSGQVQLNDILYCLRGSLGKCSIVEGIKQGAIASSLVIVRMPESVDSVYILNYFLSTLGKQMIYKHDNGTAQPNLSASNVKEFYLPLPPLEEQKEIVKVVETLFKEVEQLEQLTVKRIGLKEDFVTSALNQLTTNNAKQEWTFLQDHFKSFFNETTNIKKLRETVLQLAVQGKLTADWRVNNPDTEDASVLLKRIQKEKAELIKDKKIKKEKVLPKITKEEIPYELPDGWVWCRVGDILNVKSSKRVFKSDYVSGGVPFYRSKEIGQLGRGQEVTTELFITREKFESFKTNFGVTKQGDILMACIGGSIGNTWLVDDREFYYKDGNLVQLDCIPEIDSFFLLKYLDSNVFYDSALGRVSGSAYNALTIEKIKKSLFPLPNEFEQKAIVDKVNALMGLCDKLEQELQQSQEHSEQLMQSCLREVFEG